MKEAKINTRFGKVSISFQTTEDLKNALNDLEEQINVITQVADRITPPTPRTAKPGYERAYRFSPNSDLEILHIPKYRHELVALALFAYHPQPVSSADIERFTGINKVTSAVITLPQNKDYFQKIDDKYAHTLDGLKLVNERVGGPLSSSVQPGETDRDTLEAE